MAQTGATPISLYYSATTTNVPTAGNLVAGELAINTNDGKLFYKDSSGVVQTLATKDSASGSFTNLAYTGTLTGGTGVVNLGSGQFYKDASGNIGVGISAPAAKLHTVGEIYAAQASTNSQQIRLSPQATDANIIYSTYSGTNSYLPLAFNVGGAERMRIDASGSLLVGTTAAAGKAIISTTTAQNTLTLENSLNNYNPLTIHSKATTGDNVFVAFGTEASFATKGTITYNRGAGLTAYNVTSDYRAKDIIGAVLDSGEVIDSVPVYMGKMKDATQARPMFIAHETPDYAHTGEKDAVDKDGNPVYQQMDASSLVPVLWAEVQSLRKRLTALEAK